MATHDGILTNDMLSHSISCVVSTYRNWSAKHGHSVLPVFKKTSNPCQDGILI